MEAVLNRTLVTLSIYEIAELWTDDLDLQKKYLDAMHGSYLIDVGHDLWIYKEYSAPYREGMLEFTSNDNTKKYIDILIPRLDFCRWIILDKGNELPKDCLLTNWWMPIQDQLESLAILEVPCKISKESAPENQRNIPDSRDPVPVSLKQKNQRKRGPTKITVFLTNLCEEIDDVTAEKLVRKIKPLVGQPNCPVKKYHGFCTEVCVEWNSGSGSKQATWGKKTFQNFVSDFKKKAGQKDCQD